MDFQKEEKNTVSELLTVMVGGSTSPILGLTVGTE